MSRRLAKARPALHPGARPLRGGCTTLISMPLRASVHAITEFEFHISPVLASSRPHTGVGMVGSTSMIRVAMVASVLSRTGLPTAAARSGITPLRQHRTS